MWMTLQVASSSKAATRQYTPYDRPPAVNHRPTSAHQGSPNHNNRECRTEQVHSTRGGNHRTNPVRLPETRPRGHTNTTHAPPLVSHAERSPARTHNIPIDVSSPPRGVAQSPRDHVDSASGRPASNRNFARNANRKANASFAREMKESLAGGRPVTYRAPEGQNDLKGRWHAAAKEVAYSVLDLRKEGWRNYNMFEKVESTRSYMPNTSSTRLLIQSGSINIWQDIFAPHEAYGKHIG